MPAGRPADDGIIIRGYEGVEIPFCISCLMRIGQASLRASKYGGDE